MHESHPGEVIMAAVPVAYNNVQHRIHDQRDRTRTVDSSSRPPFETPIKTPFEGGPRLALLYLAFEALRAYGVLNESVRLTKNVHNKSKDPLLMLPHGLARSFRTRRSGLARMAVAVGTTRQSPFT